MPHRSHLSTVSFLTLLAINTIASSAVSTAAAPPDAPHLLAERCGSCHDAAVRSGGIDLSSRAAAIAAGAFVPGNPDTSKLIRMVRAGKMPPSGKLPDAEITLLEQWVKAGASWAANSSSGTWWSLQPVRHPAVPHTPFDSLSSSPLDRFLFARLAQKGLKPSPLASRPELLRRVTIDLTGLPPTPEEIQTFVADCRPGAYERVVDRLLASPAYGECWGRHWLDVVRFGESNGYEQNHLRPNAWPYRDYVIGAFNRDTPYNRFILEQLAGDTLQDPASAAATGFLVAGVHDTVGIQEEVGTRQQRANDLDDMVATTGATFLGLSVGCARCHNHKFDPIPQKDYYRLTACFAGVRHGERTLATPEQIQHSRDRQAAVVGQLLAVSNNVNAVTVEGRSLIQHTDAAGSRPAVNSRWNEDAFPPTAARFVRFTVLATNDNTEPCLDELQVFGIDPTRDLALAQQGGRATASSLLPNVAIHQIDHLNDGRLGNEWSWISNSRGGGWAQVELAQPTLVQRVVWSRDGGSVPRFDDRLPVRYRIELSLDGKTWITASTEAGRQGSSSYLHPDDIRKALPPARQRQLAAWQQQRGALEAQLVTADANATAYIGQFTTPDPTYLLHLGDVMQRQELVTPGALSCVSSLSPDLAVKPDAPEPERRVALARWLTDPRNPLTPRVMVNRIWQYHFGHGLVTTPSDYGKNGVPPTHPELLDWLASDFVAGGWKLKRLHRLIVTSYAYRQGTAANAKGLAVDAGDQLLWRMPVRRMDAEAIRDAILQTSGKLDRRMGGPSYPLFNYRVVNVAIYAPLENYAPQTWRRSVYAQQARAIHDELLSAFDCPESSQRAPRRETTTTPLQALNLLNGPFIQQQAAFMAERIQREAGPSPDAQLRRAFTLTFGRPPAPDEATAARPVQLYLGLPALCRVLLNTNEFLYY